MDRRRHSTRRCSRQFRQHLGQHPRDFDQRFQRRKSDRSTTKPARPFRPPRMQSRSPISDRAPAERLTIVNDGVIKSTGTGDNAGQALDLDDIASPMPTRSSTTMRRRDSGGRCRRHPRWRQRHDQQLRPDRQPQRQQRLDGNDAIDFQARTGGVVNNFAGGVDRWRAPRHHRRRADHRQQQRHDHRREWLRHQPGYRLEHHHHGRQ